jgi:hypothetical protein
MPLLSEVQERSWASDKYGDQVLRWKFDWRDTRIMRWINNFERIGTENTEANIERQDIESKAKNSEHMLRRSLKWKTWSASGGDAQVFEARYIYYAKFVELAVGRGEPYDSPVPDIPHPKWKPIKVATRTRKGKPHVVTEMRTQASKFTAYARAHFQFYGTIYMIYAMGNNKGSAAAYNRAVAWALERQD